MRRRTRVVRGVLMSYSLTIVCLANSRKCSGRCIAGKEIGGGGVGGWVRPVSDRESREISEEERRYRDGSLPHPLDIITIPMKKPLPEVHQSENHLIDQDRDWEKTGIFPWSDMPTLIDSPLRLWATNCSSYSGRNNRVPAGEPADSSLYLIQPSVVTLVVGVKAAEYPDSKRTVRAQFHYNSIEYLIDVTDPHIERIYLGRSDGEHTIEIPYVCISLGDEYNGYCYKFAAAILTRDRSQ